MREFIVSLLSLLLMSSSGCVAEVDEPFDDFEPDAEPVAFQSLGDLAGGNFESHAYGVSPDGKVVVGDSYSKAGEKEAFRWTQSRGMVGLGDLPPVKGIHDGPFRSRFSSRAEAASHDGKVIVGSGTPGSTTAFRWTKDGGMQYLVAPTHQSTTSSAQDISSDGKIIVGNYMPDPISRSEAFRWTKSSGIKGLGGLLPGGSGGSIATAISSDGSTIVGDSEATQGAFRWTKATGIQSLGQLPEGVVTSRAVDVSGDGSVIVGTLGYGGTKEMGFRWTQVDSFQSLPDLPGGHEYCTAGAVSEDGLTIVGAAYSEVGSEAVRWTKDGGVETIRQLLVDRGVDMPGWRLWIATDVSSDGSVIVGYGMNPNKKWEAWRVDLSVPPAPVAK